MRAIDSREQDSLSRICRKLREGDVVKFVSELTHLRGGGAIPHRQGFGGLGFRLCQGFGGPGITNRRT
jgi:hypothetical protein